MNHTPLPSFSSRNIQIHFDPSHTQIHPFFLLLPPPPFLFHSLTLTLTLHPPLPPRTSTQSRRLKAFTSPVLLLLRALFVHQSLPLHTRIVSTIFSSPATCHRIASRRRAFIIATNTVICERASYPFLVPIATRQIACFYRPDTFHPNHSLSLVLPVFLRASNNPATINTSFHPQIRKNRVCFATRRVSAQSLTPPSNIDNFGAS